MEAASTLIAPLTEIFSSVQGEGPYLGVRQIFVRFYGCHRRCVFCDSPETVTAWQPAGFQPATYQLEQHAGRRDFQTRPNPVTVDGLIDELAWLNRGSGPHHSVSFTGGEPLLHAAFLGALLPQVEHLGLKTYLETAGDLYTQLDPVLPWLDIAAMDIKLPSVTRNEPAWVNHRKFLARCVEEEVEVFAKAILSADTSEADLVEACRVLTDVAPDTPLVLQPMTPFGEARNAPTPLQLLDWQALCLRHLRDVRVVPQAHKMMGQL